MKSSKVAIPGKWEVPLCQCFCIYIYFSSTEMNPMPETLSPEKKKRKKEMKHSWGRTELRFLQITFLNTSWDSQGSWQSIVLKVWTKLEKTSLFFNHQKILENYKLQMTLLRSLNVSANPPNKSAFQPAWIA